MEYVAFDREIAVEALRRSVEGRSIYAAEFNAIVALLAIARDRVLGAPRLTVRVPSSIGVDRAGTLAGSTYGESSTVPSEQAMVAANALGYAIRRLRSGHRIVRPGSAQEVPIGVTWPDIAALVGEPSTAIVSPTGVRPDSMIEIDPSAAADASNAWTYASAVLAGSSPAGDVAARVSWMSREYVANSRRSEWTAYVALGGATIALLLGLGAFKRRPKPTQASSPGMPGIPANPYGAPLATPNWY
jgi:hypothetical protein